MNLAQWLWRAAHVYPDRPAVLYGDQLLWRYAELAHRSACLAGHLRHGLGLAPGDRVALFMGNHPCYLEILYAAWWAGLVVVPINAKLHGREAHYILDHAQARVLFVSAELQAGLPDLPAALCAVLTPDSPAYAQAVCAPALAVAHREPDDLAWLFYTSGTTGRPKGVMLSHRNLQSMTGCYFMDVDDVADGDAIVYAAPMSHGAGLYNFSFVARAARHVVPVSAGFDPAELVALSRSVGQLVLFAAPTMVKRLVDHVQASGDTAEGFKTVIYGGGPMYAAHIEQALDVMGPRWVQIYGQGESPMTITALSRACLADRQHPQWRARMASVGVAQSAVRVQVVDDQGHELPVGQTGEVVVCGDTVMRGYWRDPTASEQALRGGWLWTGDLGEMDHAGFLTLKDRSKDVIISGGANIYPREVEEVLLRHPQVREVAVVGQPDPEWGEVVVAFVVATDVDAGPEAGALDQLCLDHIARFKRPKHYHFVAELPKNHYGKVLKTVLREQLPAPPAPGT